MTLDITPKKSNDAKGVLRWAALFLGELRDGLTMINMQSAFLMVSKNYSEKQVGILFFTFGMSQFLFQTPAGYLLDYTDRKVFLLCSAGVCTTLLTVFTAIFAQEYGGNLGLMIFIKFLQGAVTALIPPGLNSITQGIVGAVGMTDQVSMNEMMNHLGTAIIVLTGSLIAYFRYPNIGILFIVSPIACVGFLWFLNRIKPQDIDLDAARGLTIETHADDKKSSDATSTYEPPPKTPPKKSVATKPSFNFGWGSMKEEDTVDDTLHAETPLQVLRDPILLTFIGICFLFHTSNGTVLPLVMQSLALGNGRSGILMSGFCIILAQLFMVASARICGQFSGKLGRKPLFLLGLFSVPVRCLILTGLIALRGDDTGPVWLQIVILSTQILDGVGAGIFGTMYILVTSDISGGTGRFSLTLGLTTAAMSIGGTVSGYLGEALAQDLGYKQAFFILMFMSLVPALVYLFFMPETLPALTGGYMHDQEHAHQQMTSIQEHHEEDDDKKTGNYTELV
jgi:MFS family permease